MYEINHEVRVWNEIANMTELVIHPVFCVSCGRPIIPNNEGMIPFKCPHCGKMCWEE